MDQPLSAQRRHERMQHYADFYGLTAAPTVTMVPSRRRKHGPEHGSRPTVAVVGNCQAESLRIGMASSDSISSFRIPPIHEWSAEDLPHVRRALAVTDVLVSQPILDNYRGLPIGTNQLAKLLPRHTRTVLFPVLRFDGLMPFQAIIRPATDPGLNPPVVPYHDLRILSAAARSLDGMAPVDSCPETYKTAAQLSVEQLAAREHRWGTVIMSDVLAATPIWHTINHPDNATLFTLAQRVLDELHGPGSSFSVDPSVRDVEMLGHLRAPIDAATTAAFNITAPAGRDQWREGRNIIAEELIIDSHLEFYADHPDVTAGLARHAQRLELFGLMP